jgi:predicted porin
MKKAMALVASVAVCTLVQAQSNVQLAGLADVYVGSMKMAGAAQRDNLLGSGGMTTSWWGMKASEDLGGGLKAEAQFNGFLRLTNGATGRFDGGDTMFSRDANLTLSGGFGAITLGRAAAPNFLPSVFFNPLGDSFGFSPLIIHNNVNLPGRYVRNNSSDTGWSSQVRYSTPTVAGLRGSVSYQLSGISGKANVGGNVFYMSGPIGLTAYYERNELTNPNAAAFSDGSTRKAWMLGASYDAKVVKGFATFGEADLTAAVSQKTFTVGASVPVGPSGKVLLAYADSNPSTGNTRQTFTAGYDHTLSKRTDVYAMLVNDRIQTLSSGTSLAVGVRHRF